ncbi:3-methyladenine DNA glycosylase AlkC [Ereboglobus sp. PH5-5]|uniref:DNA alkylation repair protein n=1 Tax=Ereboglobus sp. PH5-5 TaxID=2940529 RepID=UPI0024071EF6|nr:DNA alkylation repair protein [Ereboglobus sp. PH5-5]MDF9831967.1 3-methyladenine DNA glycosylase AlkC [Ereboglobus sp. PH5-5]
MSAPALKDTLFNTDRFRLVARELSLIEKRFDAKRFLALSFRDFENLSLMQRLRRMTESLHATLPDAETNYRKTLATLRALAPALAPSFAMLVFPDYVALHGTAPRDFDMSMDALKFFTPFGSSEFAVREFIRRDQPRALAIMQKWSRDPDEHVRRLSSEGCRPRLPWSFRLDSLVQNPAPVAPILENLRADSSLYVRKSVANHLNDITKDNPDWVFARIKDWPLENEHTIWIVKHALRTLIKKGDRRALAVIGAGEKARVQIDDFKITPRTLKLGERLGFSFTLKSTAKKSQRLVVDYAMHYVKKAGHTTRKVFKLKTLTLAPRETITITRNQRIENFTTRTHYAGRHEIEIIVNGETFANDGFDLKTK